jgi:hypothetical protein
MIKIDPSGDYVQLKYVDTLGEYVQEELLSDSDAIEYSSSSNGKLYLQFGKMTFQDIEPTEFEIDGVAVTDAADFITKLTALFSGGGGSGSSFFPTSGTGTATGDITGQLDGHIFQIQEEDYPVPAIMVDPTGGQMRVIIEAFNETGNGNYGYAATQGTETYGDAQLAASFNDGINRSNVHCYADATTATLDIGPIFNNGEKTGLISMTAYEEATETTLSADFVTTNGQASFNGKIVSSNLASLDFANDGAAASGGVDVGQLYHTSGTVKIRLI